MHVLVDVTYLGLPLAQQAKLSALAEDSAYLELPHPMPVGSKVLVLVEEGVQIPATVTEVHEQVVGVDRPPGMAIRPTLDAAAQLWWKGRGATVPRRSRGYTAVAGGLSIDAALPPSSAALPTQQSASVAEKDDRPTVVMTAVTDAAEDSPSAEEFTKTAVMPAVFPDADSEPPTEAPEALDATETSEAQSKPTADPSASGKGRARGKKRNRRR